MALPVIRSGDLFANYSDDEQAAYFDAVAVAPSSDVLPEHVFGTNGWRRRLAATDADPVAADEAFRIRWDSIPPEERRDAMEANAIARRYGDVESDVIGQAGDDERYVASVLFPSNPAVAVLAAKDPVVLSELTLADAFGRNPMEV